MLRERINRLLLIGNPEIEDVFVPNFVLALKRIRPDIEISVLCLERIHEVPRLYQDLDVEIISPLLGRSIWFEKIPKLRFLGRAVQLKHISNRIGSYDLGHIHYVNPLVPFITSTLASRCRNIIASIYGSDFYRTSEILKYLQKHTYDNAKRITFTNAQTQDDFNKYYKGAYAIKTLCMGYGSVILDSINSIATCVSEECKTRLGINPKATVVVCGSNGSPFQQHASLIDSLTSKELPHDLTFVFPMTYGCSADYVSMIERKLSASELSYKIFDRFLSDTEVACLRRASSIFINVQKTDQLSGAMQEHLYADNVVITGSWLPYKCFEDNGILLNKVDAIEQVADSLVNMLRTGLDRCRSDASTVRKVIWDMSSWDLAIRRWLVLYNEIGC